MMQKERIIIDIQYTQDLDEAIHGIASQRGENIYTIWINGKMEPVAQLATFLHEMTHIFRHDHDKQGANVGQIEIETQQQLIEALELLQSED